MKSINKMDMHMHSIVSDGTDSPLELIQKVADAGIELFSLTDHDAIAGSLEIQKELKKQNQHNLIFVPGVEFSARDKKGKYHILGYNYSADSQPIQQVVEKAHHMRLDKVSRRLRFIEDEFGFKFSEVDLKKLMANHNPGKPHIANMMVEYGYAKNRNEAIREYLNKKRFPNMYLSPKEVIHAIVESGGIPILAHPSYGDGDQIIVGEEMRHRIEHLMRYGLQGLEAYYSGFTPKLEKECLDFAKEYQLYVSAGSDYHGTNKLEELGQTGLDDTDDGVQELYNFLEQIVPEE